MLLSRFCRPAPASGFSGARVAMPLQHQEGPSPGGVPPRVGSLPKWRSLPSWGLDMLLGRSDCSFCVSVGLNCELWMASAGPPSRNAPSGRCTLWESESWVWGGAQALPSSGHLGVAGGHSCCSPEHRRCPGSSLSGGGLARVH